MVVVLAILTASVTSATGAVTDPMWTEFGQSVYGDFVTVGNTVTACPNGDEPVPPRYPADRCRAAWHGEGGGVAALNNSHFMRWADVDDDPDTFNSSTAQLTIPPGAGIAYAKLSWAGVTGDQADVPCGRDSPRPAGEPARQGVSLTVGGRPAVVIGPDRFRLSTDAPEDLTNTDQRFYSGQADVTGELRGAFTGVPLAVTVANVWTPQGFDCFGGWSVVVVWKFDGPSPRYAPARKQVLVHGGHVRMFTGMTNMATRLGGMRAAGGVTRVGVTAYEGDRATGGDEFLVNGTPQRGSAADNFFGAHADGAVNPAAVNNMSVDVVTVEVPDSVIHARDTSAEFAFTSATDAYLVTSLAVSLPAPALVVTSSVDRPAAHKGDRVTQTVTVSNPSTAPADQVIARLTAAQDCDRVVGPLPGGAKVTVSCAGRAPDDDYRMTATATGVSLVGDELEAGAETPVEVLRPALAVAGTVRPATVLSGQRVEFEVGIRNTGDTPLAGLSLSGTGCVALDPATIGPGQALTTRCAVTAGAEGFTNTVNVTGKDRLGLEVNATAAATVTVIHPRATAVRPASQPVPPGRPAEPVIAGGVITLAMLTSLLVMTSMNATRRG